MWSEQWPVCGSAVSSSMPTHMRPSDSAACRTESQPSHVHTTRTIGPSHTAPCPWLAPRAYLGPRQRGRGAPPGPPQPSQIRLRAASPGLSARPFCRGRDRLMRAARQHRAVMTTSTSPYSSSTVFATCLCNMQSAAHPRSDLGRRAAELCTSSSHKGWSH